MDKEKAIDKIIDLWIEQDIEDTLNFEDKGMEMLLDQMEVKMIFEDETPLATYQLSKADVEPELTARGLALTDIRDDQWEDIAHYTQKGLEGFMDGWDIIIENAVYEVLGAANARSKKPTSAKKN